jgi:WD40 repeat protein/serine/threonine protein kinase
MKAASISQGQSVESLMAVVAEEFLERLDRGEQPDIEEYAGRYPEIATFIRQMLPTLQLLRTPSGDLSWTGTIGEPAGVRGCLGDFRLMREVGRGGMGVVYEAEQISLGRRVALKILPFAAALDSKQLQRFKNEAQAAAHLHHTNIVPVFGVGCERGVHYYAMQFIEGHTLAAVIQELRQNVQGPRTKDQGRTTDETPSTTDPATAAAAQTGIRDSTLDIPWSLGIGHSSFFRTVANLGIQAAEALEHAHELGVVHRDIKPANLLVDGCGNLWITDFGLAHCHSQPALTMTGDLVGTLRYMSPEQALGKRLLIDHRTDLYSLGVTLYELLTLEPDFSGRDREELLRQIAFEEPPAPHHRNKAIPKELETIILKTMEKNPEARYATAKEAADDLQRFLDQKPIQARRPTILQRASKWCRRNPLLAGALTAVVATIVLGTVVAWLLAVWALRENSRADDRAAEADRQRKAVQEANEEMRQRWYAASTNLMQQAWDSGQMGRLRSLLAETEDYPDRDFEWYYCQRLCHLELQTFVGHRAGLTALSWSPNGKWLATGSGDATVRVWDVASGRCLLTLGGHTGRIGCVAWSPDGKWLASASEDTTAKIWEAIGGRLLQTLRGHGGGVYGVSWSPDGKRLVTANEDGTAKVWGTPGGRELRTIRCHSPAGCTYVSWSPDEKLLATSSADTTAKLWEADTGRLFQTLKGHTNLVTSVCWSPDSKLLATGSWEGIVRVWVAASGREVRNLQGDSLCVAWSPDGKWLGTGGETATVWEGASGRQLLSLKGHAAGIMSVCWSPDGKRLATASMDGTAKVWKVAASREFLSFSGHTGQINSLPWSPDCRRLATGGIDGSVKVWDAADWRVLLKLDGHTDGVESVAWSPNGKLLAAGCGDGTTKIWEAAGGHQLLTLKRHTQDVRCVAWSPDGKRLATGSWDGTAKIWQPGGGQEPITFRGHSTGVLSLAWSPDGRYLATSSLNGTIKVWDAASGRERFPLKGHTNWVQCVSWSPDGKRLASGRRDGTVRLWDAASGQGLPVPENHTNLGWVFSVVWSPDGKRLAVGSRNGTVKIWEAAQGRQLLSLKGHTSGVLAASWSPDGNRLAAGHEDGTITVWDAADAVVVQEWARQERVRDQLLAVSPIRGPQAQGFIQDWLLLLPIPYIDEGGGTALGEGGGKALDRQQLSGAAMLRPKAGQLMRVGSQELVWRTYHSPESILDFNAVLGQVTEHSVAYAVCYLESDRARNDLWLQVGSDDQAKVYLNGREAYQCRPGRLTGGDISMTGPVVLQQGINVLVFKVVNVTASWEGCVRLLDAAGRPAEGIRVTLTPE